MTTVQTVLFDIDGTLIDSVRLILDSYHHTLAAHGFPPRSDEEWLRGVGTPLSVQLAEWSDDRGTLEALIATYREYNLAHHDRMVTVYPGVVDSVEAIRAAGRRRVRARLLAQVPRQQMLGERGRDVPDVGIDA